MPRRRLEGTVLSHQMNKTAVVIVERLHMHRLYRKVVRSHKRYHVHDEANEAHVGDRVVVEECRPVSRTKHWRIVDFISRGSEE